MQQDCGRRGIMGFTMRPLQQEESLEHTPTWAVGAVCILFVLVSISIQRSIFYLGNWLKRNRHWPLHETLEKMKSELMLLGFISLLLTFFRNHLARVCIPERVTEFMLPCNRNPVRSEISINFGHRRMFGSRSHGCPEGHYPLMSTESLQQLHIFIFVMAVVHIAYSCLTMLLGLLQMGGWKKWEDETHDEGKNYNSVEGLRLSFKLGRQTSFAANRASHPWTNSLVFGCVDSFFRQFGRSVTKADYLTLRLGFVKNHNAGNNFDFLRYMMRTLEDDFKVVVGISGYLWVFVIMFLLLNIHGWYTYFWISFVPVILLLLLGTKLQQIITQLAIEVAQSEGLIGDSLKPRDELFWFRSPQFLLYLIHFILFQNSFELAYFFWLWTTYGLHSCFMEKRAFIYVRVLIGFISQILCSYTTLPLYALVTQMGSTYKKGIFESPVTSAIQGWRLKAMENRKKREVAPGGPYPKPKVGLSPLGMNNSESTHKSWNHKIAKDDKSQLEAWQHNEEETPSKISTDFSSSNCQAPEAPTTTMRDILEQMRSNLGYSCEMKREAQETSPSEVTISVENVSTKLLEK